MNPKPGLTNRLLFLFGLIFFLIGQLLLAKGNDFVYNQEPIDFAHWFLLVGVTLLIPQTVTFPKKIYSLIGIPLTLIGIVCIIGMCVLDFIWWSFPTEETRIEFTNHISQVPSIWKPFITIGPSSKIFNLGLLILSLNYLKENIMGVLLILLAALILWNIIPLPFRLVFGYVLTLIGFSMILLKIGSKKMLQ
ncbi:hypothetical protein [Maribacter sp. HTCC2170]|uniref:hypothetical protein n=1 Tax=Maribacter sp. (strain HTCC2170 / KCCM 42371) TaxID=313603 RepID=UPI00006BE0B1|nr:hypothetical protein [Maribacter sp. HTCC2170]EAR00017.1 hypothetical protein FB2170_01547 [Maribacter sp. HTCC2170]